MNRLVIACVDVGKPNNVGWASLDGGSHRTGNDLHQLIKILVTSLEARRPVALGFECPLYVPSRDDLATLNMARMDEGKYPWSGIGASVLAAGLPLVAWVLRQLHSAAPSAAATTRWGDFATGFAQMLVWEAFVTSTPGDEVVLPKDCMATTDHQRDALAGAIAFLNGLPGVDQVVDSPPRSALGDEAALSIIGMQILASGMGSDLGLLRERCLVARATKPR